MIPPKGSAEDGSPSGRRGRFDKSGSTEGRIMFRKMVFLGIAGMLVWATAGNVLAQQPPQKSTAAATAAQQVQVRAQWHRTIAALLAEQAKADPDEEKIASLRSQLDELRTQMNARTSGVGACPFGGPVQARSRAGVGGTAARYGAGAANRGGPTAGRCPYGFNPGAGMGRGQGRGYGRGPAAGSGGRGRGPGGMGPGYGRGAQVPFVDANNNGICDNRE
ncbi:MAG: hypothetical protein D6741_02020 [Planctomycetota bacterium]|nr:MAG: hypothetical protein D6741_02020 [Planctomycetota bacterium]